jgi:hypothetical protein
VDVPDEEFDPEELEMGIEVETEHTDDLDEAKQIAKDHLAELPDYYTRLKKMEEEGEEELGKESAHVMARGFCTELGKIAAERKRDLGMLGLATGVGAVGGGVAGGIGEIRSLHKALEKLQETHLPRVLQAPDLPALNRASADWSKAIDAVGRRHGSRMKFTVPAALVAGALLGGGGYVGYKKLRKKSK